jgi:hypothetical protein
MGAWVNGDACDEWGRSFGWLSGAWAAIPPLSPWAGARVAIRLLFSVRRMVDDRALLFAVVFVGPLYGS